ncbi:ribbon-helix-helix protein, CopG family [Candidatus Poriferisodalis sp.]|uniref:ribbon-helix-helix protein, CopG family n=1 Tax=Candidatus Poriferisodalis sp. TaxID=3101277 RepID=UPI003C6FA0A2
MTATKSRLTITVDSDIVDRVKALVAQGGASSVSAYVEHSVQCQLAADADFDVLLATMLDETGGPLTPDERAAARRVLSGDAAA